jgi:hypothetical protein
MDEPACPGCRALLKRVAELETLVADLSRRLEEALRAGKRQAAPFAKRPPNPDPAPPGRPGFPDGAKRRSHQTEIRTAQRLRSGRSRGPRRLLPT